MKRIKVLDKYISELIAAGEVVERPSSVVKELVENSIDAGASKITVEIKHGGVSMIKVSDNGSGIHKDDVKTAFLRHSTSKIQNSSDLDSIKTLGFRGEALCSICAVSKVELFTAQKGEKWGVRYLIEGGEEKLFEEAGRTNGTTFIVRDLFFNTPARMKFLKRDISEANAVADILDRIALSHPEIAFSFIRDGKFTMNTQGDGELFSCIYSIYGKNIADYMVPVEYNLNGISLKGFISRPEAARPSRTLQNFFVNNRFVKSKIASSALEEAFKGFVMVGKHPLCVLYLDVLCETVDVNVHPAKTEVRFINEKAIYETVYYGVKSALMRDNRKKEIKLSIENKTDTLKNSQEKNIIKDLAKNKITEINSISLEEKKCDEIRPRNSPKLDIEYSDDDENLDTENSNKNFGSNFTSKIIKNLNTSPLNIDFKLNDCSSNFPFNFESFEKKEREDCSGKNNGIYSKINISEDIISSNKKSETFKADLEHISPNKNNVQENTENLSLNIFKGIEDVSKNILGEIFDCYILAQENDKLIFIDKHAAHERILYNELKKNAEKDDKDVPSQTLLEPIAVSLDKICYSALLQNLDLTKKSGYQIEDFGNGVVIVRSAPVYLRISDIESAVIEIAEYLMKNRTNINTQYLDWIYHNIACRAAIKAGKKSSREEIEKLIRTLEKNPDIMYCPHGRPIYIELKKKDIEKHFGRN